MRSTLLLIMLFFTSTLTAAGISCTSGDVLITRDNITGTVDLNTSTSNYESDWFRFTANATDAANGITFTVRNLEGNEHLVLKVVEYDSSASVCDSVTYLTIDTINTGTRTMTGVVDGKTYAISLTAATGTVAIPYTFSFSSNAPAVETVRFTFDGCNVESLGTISNTGSSPSTGTLRGAKSALGKICNGLQFKGAEEDSADLGAVFNPNGNAYSYAFWVFYDGVPGENRILDNNDSLVFAINTGQFQVKQPGSSYEGNVSITPRIWTHLVIINDGNTLKIYKNTALAYDSAIANSAISTTLSQKYILGSNSTKDSSFYTGVIDELKMYSGVLSSFDRLRLFNENRICPCCETPIQVAGGYVNISDTYDANAPAWDKVTFANGYSFTEPPIVFIVASDQGGHSADMRIRNITRTGFETANIEPQGEDGPHIAMQLSYLAISRGIHTLGENNNTVEVCSYATQTEQYNQTKSGSTGDINLANVGWDRITPNSTFSDPTVVAQTVTANNEQRRDPRTISRPWFDNAIENNSSGIFFALDRGETTAKPITYPEEVGYMIAENDIQDWFLDDLGRQVWFETIRTLYTFQGYNQRGNADQFIYFNLDYSDANISSCNAAANSKPLIAANMTSRVAPDGGWIRRNTLYCDRVGMSIWEDRRGSWSNGPSYGCPTSLPECNPSALQDSERDHNDRESIDAFIFGSDFFFSAAYEVPAGAFNAVEVGGLNNTDLQTKVIDKNTSIDIISVDPSTGNLEAYNGPVMVQAVVGNTCNPDTQTATALLRDTSRSVPLALDYAIFDYTTTDSSVRQTVDINITEIARIAAIKMTYLTSGGSGRADLEDCYNDSFSDCASFIPGACSALCTSQDDMKGIGTLGRACLDCVFTYSTNTRYACSYDPFAVRPNHFEILVNHQNRSNDPSKEKIVAEKDFTLEVFAVSGDSNISQLPLASQLSVAFTRKVKDYNETRINTTTDSFSFGTDFTDSSIPVSCALDDLHNKVLSTDTPLPINNMNPISFADGNFTTFLATYPEIGDINITIRENNGSEFAFIDADDTSPESNDSIRLIRQATVPVTFTPKDFNASQWRLHGFADLSNFAYFDNNITDSAIKMGAELDLNISAKGDDGNLTKAYSNGCFSEDSNITLTLNIVNYDDDNLSLHVYSDYNQSELFYEGNVSYSNNIIYNVPSDANISNLQFTLHIPSQWFFEGVYRDTLRLNFERNSSLPRNPISMTASDLRIDDMNDINGSSYDTTPTPVYMYYGRAHIPKTKIIGDEGNVTVYYEVYCANQCTPTLMPQLTNNGALAPQLSIDDVKWYINRAHQVGHGRVTALNTFITANASTITTPTFSFNNIVVRYDESKGYPFKPQMRGITEDYLVYNRYESNLNYNRFELEFYSPTSAWSGKAKVNEAVDSNASSITNRRIQW